MSSEAPNGIDLQEKYLDVQRILFAKFGGLVNLLTTTTELQKEDILQEVYKGLLARNKGKCPFDSNKSRFGTYVHMVCRCILSNLVNKYVVRAKREIVTDNEILTRQARPLWSRPVLSESSVLKRFDEYLQSRGENEDLLRARQAAPLVFQGFHKRELIRALACKGETVDRTLSYLQKAVREWAALGADNSPHEEPSQTPLPDNMGWFLEALCSC